MAIKKSRQMKVYGQSGYHYKSTPAIMLKGQWLKELGFEIGDYISDRLGEGKHINSHVEWHMTCWYVEAALDPDADVKELIWVSRKELDQDVALPGAFKTYRKVIEKIL